MCKRNDETRRWTARRKVTVVTDIVKGKAAAAEVARTHDLTVAEVERWMDDFTSMGTDADSGEEVELALRFSIG